MSDDAERDGNIDPDRSDAGGSDPEIRASFGPGPDTESGTDDLGAAPPRRRTRLALGIGLGIVAFDQLTKWWALETLQNRTIDVIGSLRFNLAYNKGAAFSVGSGGNVGPFIAVLAVVVVVMLFRSASATASRFGALSVGLIAGGAFGNLVDRAFRSGPGFFDGAVIDFIDVQWWPVFNIADSAICLGAVTFVVLGMRDPSPSR